MLRNPRFAGSFAIALLAAGGAAAPGSAHGQSVNAPSSPRAATRTDVPVQSVMLFSSGVGFFEHTGSVRGNSATELRFKTNQINDILKSLVLEDRDGGRISAITYPSLDPVAKTLRSFQVDITANPSLASLLNQLRGARVSVQTRTQTVSGSVLGVESRVQTSNGQTNETPVLNVLTGATIRAVELPSVSSLSLEDPALQDELMKALDALSQSRDRDKKPVTISFNGAGERRVHIGYVVETPVWKTSYRLMLDDKASRLQGWAIVENQTESDWNDVSLSLVSGRPVSFMMDLYQPLYTTRPTVTQQLFAGLSPRMYEEGISGTRPEVEFSTAVANVDDYAGKGVKGGTSSGVGTGAPVASPAPPPVAYMNAGALSGRIGGLEASGFSSSDYARAVQSNANAARMGELFQYSIGNVTLARQKSAMLPIVTDTVSIDRVSIYNAAVLQRYPMNGVRLRNTTGKHLLEGPITVLDGNGYAGDAQISSIPPGQHRLLSYGVDLEMTVEVLTPVSTNNVVSGRIAKGVLLLERKSVIRRDYRAENKGSKDKTLLIEHPSMARSAFKLVGTQKPIESTDNLHRFEGNAVAGKITTLSVQEEQINTQTMQLLPTDTTVLLSYSTNGEFAPAVREALAKVIAFKQRVASIERQIAESSRKSAEITAEQTRLRENMKTVDQKSDYYKRLLQKLNDQESQLETLGRERVELQSQRDAQRSELERFVANLNVN
jgi:hypothetical protein